MPNLSKHKFNRRNFIKTTGIYSGLMIFANSSTPLFGIGKTGKGAKTQTGLSNLRCEYLVDPKSIDTIEPRLSWEMLAGDPGKRSLFQRAYRVLAASSPDILNKDQGDLWDSGKVQSDATAGIAYNGIPLTSRTLCYWKVQIWNQDDQSSGWSQVSKFTMGLLNPGDWKAKWISYQPFEPQTTAHFGYLSRYAKTADEIKWVQIDLGTVQRVNALKLWGTWMTGRNSVSGGGFPRRFKIELAVRSDFSDSRVVIDHTGDDYPNPGLEPVLLKFTPSDAQYVRLTATKLSGEMEAVWDENSSDWKPGIPTGGATDPTQKSSFLALAEMEVLKDGVNVALGKKVTALDAWEDTYFNPPIDDIPAPRIHGGWSPEYLTNGRTEPDLGSRFHNQPVTCLRREFTVGKTIKNATLYATALGAYEFRLNGERVGDHQLAPAWTLYCKRVLYQTYDVTGQLRSGPNALAAMLGDGWFRMRGWDYFGSNKRFAGFYNADDRWLLGQLEIEYADGTMETIATDGSWKCNSDGPLRHTSMYDGVFYDARRELPGWDKPGLMNKQGWTNVVEGTPVNVPVLSSQSIPPIRIIRELKSLFHKELRPGVYIYDFGEQLAGVCRIRVNGPVGTEVKLRFAQALKEDGSLYVANLMGSYDNQDVFILDGSGSKTFIPPFTYHGFRYVEVSGIGSDSDMEEITALEIGSELTRTASFSSSDNRLDKLVSIIDTAFRSNMVPGQPVDTVARDERLTYMGDCFAGQALSYLYDFPTFLTNKMRAVDDSRNSNMVCPPTQTKVCDENASHTAFWSDTGVIIPYVFWLNYGDRRSLESGYNNARKLFNFLYKSNQDGVPNTNYKVQWGDWLTSGMTIPPGATAWEPKGGKRTSNELFRISWWAFISEITSKMAAALGRTGESDYFAEIARKARETLIRDHVKPDGTVSNDEQSSYALVLGMNHLQGSLKKSAEAHLVEAIHLYKDHLATGSATTIFLLNYLAENGQQDLAYRMVMQPTCPSFGAMVDSGTTAMWERLDAWHPKLGYNPNLMNDLNQLGFNSVFEWIFGYVGGIRPHPLHPGYKHFIIAPCTGSGPEWVKMEYKSLRGLINCQWKRDGNHTELKLGVPPNTLAEVHLIASDINKIRESGKSIPESNGVRFVRKEDKGVVLEVGSGDYDFTVEM